MSIQSPSRHEKRHPALYTLGGFVVGASAVALLVAVYDANENKSQYLRGPNQPIVQDPDSIPIPFANTSKTPNTLPGGMIDLNDTNVTLKDIKMYDSKSEVDFASNDSIDAEEMLKFDLMQSSHPTSASIYAKSPTNIPTDLPTAAANFPTTMPTYFPTTKAFPTDFPTSFDDSLKTYIQTRSQVDAGFRLKMYWQGGYYWQERADERWWCMQCVDQYGNLECKKNSKMHLKNCKTKTDLDTTFSYASFQDGAGYQFRVVNTNLCLQKLGDRRAIRLKPCKDDQMLQRFIGFQPDLERFDLIPISYTDRCLTNHHHPKANETIYAETCKKAHKYDTGYWVVY